MYTITVPLPIFRPPKPTELAQSIKDLFHLQENMFATDKFVGALKWSFQNVVMIPNDDKFQKVGMKPNDDGLWSEYETSMATGQVKVEPTGTIDGKLLDNASVHAEHQIVERAIDIFLDEEDDDVESVIENVD